MFRINRKYIATSYCHIQECLCEGDIGHNEVVFVKGMHKHIAPIVRKATITDDKDHLALILQDGKHNCTAQVASWNPFMREITT